MHQLVVRRGGVIRTRYTDRLPLQRFGRLCVSRAANVEWDNEAQGWTVEFADGRYVTDPIDGTIMLFDTREAALRAEIEAVDQRL